MSSLNSSLPTNSEDSFSPLITSRHKHMLARSMFVCTHIGISASLTISKLDKGKWDGREKQSYPAHFFAFSSKKFFAPGRSCSNLAALGGRRNPPCFINKRLGHRWKYSEIKLTEASFGGVVYDFSNTVTSWPAVFNKYADVNPAIPAPTTMILSLSEGIGRTVDQKI